MQRRPGESPVTRINTKKGPATLLAAEQNLLPHRVRTSQRVQSADDRNGRTRSCGVQSDRTRCLPEEASGAGIMARMKRPRTCASPQKEQMTHSMWYSILSSGAPRRRSWGRLRLIFGARVRGHYHTQGSAGRSRATLQSKWNPENLQGSCLPLWARLMQITTRALDQETKGALLHLRKHIADCIKIGLWR